MNISKTCFFVLMCCALLIGCEQDPSYQIVKNEDGSFYRLNSKTGEMLMIDGQDTIALKTPEMKQHAV